MLFQFLKKDDERNVKNYRHVSVLPICREIFERLICNVMRDFLSDNNLFSSNQSAFRSGDSCINQLLSVTHDILKMYLIKEYYKRNVGVRGILLDISKAFEKIWHDRLIFKQRQNGISGYNILRDFLRNRKQRVVLNGQC